MPDLKASLGSAMQAVPGGSTVAEATGFKEKGMFPGLSMKQRVKYFAYAFIGANVAYTLVRPPPPRSPAQLARDSYERRAGVLSPSSVPAR